MTKKNVVELVGVDDGYAFTKTYGADGRMTKICTSVAVGLHGVSKFDGDTSSDGAGAYETEGLKYTVGDAVDGEDTRSDSYPGSAMNRVVVHHALIRAGYGGKDVAIATGLPVNGFYSGNSINKKMIDRKVNSFKTAVTGVEETANILESLVCSEAVSAYLDYILDDNGNLKPDVDLSQPVGIVDIGGRTTDSAWIIPPDSIDHTRSGTLEIGVLALLDEIERGIAREYGIKSLTRQTLESTAKSKKIRLFGKEVDVPGIVDSAVKEVSEKISNEIDRRFQGGAELGCVIFVGGGAVLMPEITTMFSHAVIPEHPEFANARGMYKFLKYSNNQKKA